MRYVFRDHASHLSRLAMILSFGAILSACSPDRDIDLASPATSTVQTDDGDGRSVAFSSAGTSVTSVPAGRPASTRSSRIGEAKPQRETVYYIEFRSRSALSYGHTFASVGELDAAGNIATSEIIGLHPATESPIPWMIGHILPVPSETGASDGDKEEQYWTARYRIRMNKQRFDAMMTEIRALQASSPAWHAVLYNCNAFIGDVAKLIGLKAPSNPLLFPKEYIEELATLNGA